MPVLSRPACPLVERAGVWFRTSGIQEPSGGVARYFRTDLQRNARVSTEITGYAVSTFVYLYDVTRDESYLEAAASAARFLTRTAWSPELAIFPFEHGEGAEPLAYFFDSGIIARGLLALWRATGDREWLTAAAAAGESMLRDFSVPDGSAHPILRLPSKEPLTYEPGKWSRAPGCYQLKSALAWRDLAEAGAGKRFHEAWTAARQYALASQEGFLPASDRTKTMDRLHAYCYFLEALLAEPDRDVLAGGIERVARHLRDIAPEFVRSDVHAQLLRVRLWADEQGLVALDREAAREEAEAIPAFQSATDGGFLFGRQAGQPLPFTNPVSTAFCLQAWQMWQDSAAGHAALI